MDNDSFNILCIDGGGVRGLFPAKILADLEFRLTELGYANNKIYQNFNLICGTSTGGIIAIALALGIPAQEIVTLYQSHANKIFKKRPWYNFLKSSYDNANLEDILRNTFKDKSNSEDLRLNDCKTNVCVPIYDLLEGKPSVLKNKYHPRFTRDYHIPAYQAAIATASAPTYFDPFSSSYKKINSDVTEYFSNKVDGGVFANNPSLLGLIEAQKAFDKRLDEIKILSIGTGQRKFTDAQVRTRWGGLYWMQNKRIIDLFLQSQAQHTSNLISLLQNGIDKAEGANGGNFTYKRIDVDYDSNFCVKLDETNPVVLNKLFEKAAVQYQAHGSNIIETYCRSGSNLVGIRTPERR